jgi:hypothetical protein
MTPGLTLVTNAQLDAQDSIKNAPQVDSQHTESRLAGHIRKVWERNRRARLSVDDRLLYALRSRRGEYSPSELSLIVSGGGADPVYLKLTGTKCRAASSWIRDIILPAGKKCWGLESTELSTVPPQVEQGMQQSTLQEVIALLQAGVLTDEQDVLRFAQAVKTKTEKHVSEYAKKTASKMEAKIEDLMEEGEWEKSIEEFIEDFVTYPTAFLKGPFFKRVKKLQWQENYQAAVVEKIIPNWKRISPFDMYPSPHARNLYQGDLIERMRMTRDQLYNLIGVPGYKEEEIRVVLGHFERGSLKDWIWEDFEKERLEADTTYFTSEPDTVDCLQYWGSVKGEDLLTWGMTDVEVKETIDPLKSYEVEAVLIGRNVIRCEINSDPLGLRPYHFACWDAIPSSIWGVSLPEQMEDHQKVVNACARALLTNLAVSSGPQAVVFVDMLPAGEDITDIYPNKIWQAKSLANSGAAMPNPVNFFQPNINAPELLNVLNTFEQKADDVTNVPRYSYGNEKVGGAGTTASGLSMLLNSAAKGIRRAIAHIDGNVIRPSVYQTFLYLMLNDPDPTIKGDVDVVPVGSTSLLIKDQAQVRMQTMLQQTSNPFDMQIIGMKGRAQMLREAFQLQDIDPDGIVPSEEELKIQQIQQEMMAQQQAMRDQASAVMGAKPQAKPKSAQASLPGNENQSMQNQLNGSTQVNLGS